ncbi:MAG: carboxypeptidase-like regulatory domain-containing protein, partial [Candidatus Acidiferrales bacterium]
MAAPSHAQELGTAVLNGEVTDPQGALVKDANVIAQRKDTGVERSTMTNGAGLFVFNDLVPGDYEIHVKVKGFSEFVAQVRLEVGQEANLKAQLLLASAQSTIQITDADAGSQVNT